MVSLTRRQVIIAGLATPLVPAVCFAEAQRPERLVLSGRILRRDGKPLAGAEFAVAKQRVVTDADGRFFLVSDTGAAGGIAAGARRDSEGTWRATLGLTLAAA